MRGKISMTSTPGLGTTFNIKIKTEGVYFDNPENSKDSF